MSAEVDVAVFTDHKPIILSFRKTLDHSPRQYCHFSILSAYIDDIQHINGSSNLVADSLFRSILFPNPPTRYRWILWILLQFYKSNFQSWKTKCAQQRSTKHWNCCGTNYFVRYIIDSRTNYSRTLQRRLFHNLRHMSLVGKQPVSWFYLARLLQQNNTSNKAALNVLTGNAQRFLVKPSQVSCRLAPGAIGQFQLDQLDIATHLCNQQSYSLSSLVHWTSFQLGRGSTGVLHSRFMRHSSFHECLISLLRS